jgi:hypothetical protein
MILLVICTMLLLDAALLYLANTDGDNDGKTEQVDVEPPSDDAGGATVDHSRGSGDGGPDEVYEDVEGPVPGDETKA